MDSSAPSPLEIALELAKEHQLKIVTVSERVRGSWPPQFVPAYVVYRIHVGARNERLWRRRDPVELLRLLRRLVQPPPARTA